MIRIVKMNFYADKVTEFLPVFEAAKPKIEAFEGCHNVTLVQDQNDPSLLMTISEWDDPEALERYRNSDLFKATWAKTKTHFSEKPQAWSVDKIK
ncbi:MAG: antibiotic biosynthesis monooxygenase family protein [Salibacteraceae bacterium]